MKRRMTMTQDRLLTDQTVTVPACSICGGPLYSGNPKWKGGYNAQPINDERCCENFNSMTVIPARLEQMRGMKIREQMETALWLTDRFSEPDLKAMTDDEVKEAYERLEKAVRGTFLESLFLDN